MSKRVTLTGELHLTDHGKQVLEEMAEERRQQEQTGGFVQESGMVMLDAGPGPETMFPSGEVTQREPMQFVVLSGEKARAFIRQEVHEALAQEMQPGAIDPRAYMHIDIREMDGRRWRGMVYAVEPTE